MRGFDTHDVLHDDFFCVGAQILCELYFVVGLASNDNMIAGD